MKDYREVCARWARAAGATRTSIKVVVSGDPLSTRQWRRHGSGQRLMREDANRHLDLELSSMSRL